ncbi:DNA topoisomerase 2 alpha [Echinococcus multilocularis]|uniref:DNA topoisomerase 2 n=1 Tax=Echinococcus multilocularis TaxID=6211 RepID=A0A068Y8E7_ECHMU|nr:DNA topoisomerase 2 alpha [Echinococcus multilocularis]
MADISSVNGIPNIIEKAAPAAPTKKRLSVERIYQKKTQLEHILIRPDTYIGSVSRTTTMMWVFDREKEAMVQREITYTPGLYKIFDEILVNAADNKIRDPTMNCIRIDIKPAENLIRVWNNGAGIPVVHHKVENMYVPSLIFGHLLTSSNYDDTEQKVTGGRNGYGAKLCNIFSKRFVVETSSKENKKCFKQTWVDNMTKTSEPKINPNSGEDFTCVSFCPDLDRFGMTELDADTVALFERRAYDVAASTCGVKVFLNGQRIPIKNFKDYVDLYLKGKGEDGDSAPAVYESVNPRWEIAVAPSTVGFQQVSFVNSIATTKGGKHVDYIVDQVVGKLIDIVKKKSGKSGVSIKNFQIRSHMWVFINCLVVNPTFDSQTKEFMSLEAKCFGSTCQLTEKFINHVSKSGIVESVLSWVRFKAQEKMDKQCHKSKHAKLKGIPKLDDANDAGTKNSQHCTLILTEGDSAKSLAVAGLGVVGRDRYGVFPLRGKLLNVREAPTRQIMENAEINNLIKILGLQYKNKYESQDSLVNLRYGKIMIMTDQDQDGSHIKGLLISFIHHNWPNLLRHNFLEQFITPIVKVFKGKQEIAFYSIPEFEEWQKSTLNWHTWRVKYYKGLGTSTSKEAKEYFSDMARHRIRFRYSGPEDDSGIMLAFNKNKINERKQWLTAWMEEKRRRTELGLPEDYLYGVGTHAITYHDFIHKELVLFSNMDNERSIPSLVDGLKPGQRKVMFTCLKRNQVKEIKVAQLCGAVAEMSSYHHGEVSLMGTIIGLAQDFVGSNNLNLLMPYGQFGTRLSGGKDSASARYIFTALSPLTRKIFHENDDPILNYLFEDNQKIEPAWYMPVIPMVLINGAEGIGTGWSTKVPNYDTNEVIANLRRMLDGVEPLPMLPSYRGYRGKIVEVGENRYVLFGEIAVLDDQTVEITELPAKTWTQCYKETVLEPMLNGTEKVPVSISDYKEYHTDVTVRFVVQMTQEKLREAESMGLHKFFKLAIPMTTNSMVLFDHTGCLKRYTSAQEILRSFYTLRLEWYDRRKAYMEGMLSAEARRLENQARFVMEKIGGVITIENRSKRDLVRLLRGSRYDPDPVRAWKECIDKLAAIEEATAARRQAGEPVDEAEGGDGSGVTVDEDVARGAADYNYILGMPLWSLSKERKEDLLAQRDKKQAELATLMRRTNKDLWREDLDELEAAIKKYETERQKDLEDLINAAEKKVAKQASSQLKGGRSAAAKGAAAALTKGMRQTRPDPLGRRVEPVVDPELARKAEAQVCREAKRKAAAAGSGKAADDDFLADMDDEDSQFGGNAPQPLFKRLSGTVDSEDGNTALNTLASAPLTKRGSGAGSRGGGRGRGKGASAGVKRSSARKVRQKKLTFDSSEDENDADNVSDDASDVSEFAPFKGGTGVGPVMSLAERVRNQPPRRTAAATTKRYSFYDSEGYEDGVQSSEEEVFTAVDHGQGDKAIVLSSPVKQPSSPTIIQPQTDAIGKSKSGTTVWPISYKEPATVATRMPSSTRGGRTGSSRRGANAGGGGGQRGGARLTTAAKSTGVKRLMEETDSDTPGGANNKSDDADKIFIPDSPVAPARTKAARSAQRKVQYFFGSDSDEVVEVDSVSDKGVDSVDGSNVKPRGKMGAKRKRFNSDSDEDYVPE